MRTRTKLVIGAGAAALTLSACGGVAAAPGQAGNYQASQFSTHRQQAVTNWTYVEDVAKAKRDVMQILAQRAGGS